MMTYTRVRTGPPPPPPPPFLYLGLDLGQASDYSALCIAERNRRPRYHDEPREGDPARYRVGHLQRYPLKTSYPAIVAAVAALVRDLAGRDPRPALRLVVDATGVGRPVVDLLRRERLPADLVDVTITGGDAVAQDGKAFRVPKRDLVSTVQVALQSERLKVASGLPDAATLTRELLAFQVKISIETAHDSYGAWREGAHDDLVLATALAVWYGERDWLRAPSIGTVAYQYGPPVAGFDMPDRLSAAELW